MTLEELKKIVPYLKESGVTRAGVFGSFARNEQTSSSDLDLLIELDPSKSLFDFIDIKLGLEDALGIKVDLGEYVTLKPLLRDSVLREEIRLI